MADPRDPDEIPEDEDLQEGSDAGRVDDEGGYEAEAGQEPEEFQAEEGLERPQRRDNRIRDELRAEREHRTRVEQELQQLRAEREQRQRPQEESEDQFLARVSLLDPEQRMDAKLERSTRNHQRQTALAVFAAADRADKAAFDSRAVSDPIYRKYAQEVEQVLVTERRKGRDFDRETVLDFVRGRALRMNQGKTNQAREQGQRRIQQQQSRTSGGRSDQPREQRQKRYAPGDMSPEAVRNRLEQPDAFI